MLAQAGEVQRQLIREFLGDGYSWVAAKDGELKGVLGLPERPSTYLAILDSASVSCVLALDTHRMSSLFRKAGLPTISAVSGLLKYSRTCSRSQRS